MREIWLTQGQCAIVDDADYEAVSRFKWYAAWNPGTRCFYAARRIQKNNQRQTIPMHRFILGIGSGRDVVVDHRNHDGLDNRRENLRACTVSQNLGNTRMLSTNTSGFKGVSPHPLKPNYWVARIKFNDRAVHLGEWDSAEKAGLAYATIAEFLHGEFAHIPGRDRIQCELARHELARLYLRAARSLSRRPSDTLLPLIDALKERARASRLPVDYSARNSTRAAA